MVSVIIPCHNCANFIRRAIDSVMAQTYPNIEIILVNNNSTDNTLRIINNYHANYPNYIFVYDELKRGAPAARNCGLKHAKGDWIQFLDADDELLNDKISTQINIGDNNQADIIAGGCVLKYDTGKKLFSIYREADDNIWRGLITSNLGITSSNLWRKSALLKVNGWDETLSSSQEYDLLFRLIKSSASVRTDKAFNTIVYFSGNSISKTSNIERLEKILDNRVKLRLQIKNELLSKGLLTPKLELAIDTYIYTELVRNADKVGNFSANSLKKYNPNVKLETVLKLKTKLYLKKVLRSISLG
jgi:glycosyltransferase involved in cell wall biosynthesis